MASRFLLVEDLSERAAAVLDDFIGGELALMAPPLLTYEVCNALCKAVSAGFIGRGEGGRRLDAFVRMGIDLLAFQLVDWQRALELSATKAITFYDAAYVVAAETAGVPLLTADDALLRAAAPTVKVIHLKDYG